jgi:hypothetical protein
MKHFHGVNGWITCIAAYSIFSRGDSGILSPSKGSVMAESEVRRSLNLI